MRRWTVAGAVIVLLALPAGLGAATFQGKAIDGRWFEGRAVSTTWGAYRCQMKFHGDRVFIRLSDRGIDVVGVLDDEVIVDEHEILVHDPKRGGDWTLDCFNLGR